MMFVIDIEGRGKSASRNGIVSIGVCVGHASGFEFPKVIEKRRFDLLPIPGQVMDPKCKAEFWDKQPNNLLERLQEKAVDPYQGILAFRAYLDKWDASTDNLYILSDNPAYDFGFINYYLDYFKLTPLTHNWKLEFRALHDADSYARGFCHQKTDKPWVSNKDVTSRYSLGVYSDEETPSLEAHLPEDDAEGIYRFHYALIRKMNPK